MSLLMERFRAVRNGASCSAEEEIAGCVTELRRRLRVPAVGPVRLEPFLAARNICEVTTDNTLRADGALVPRGADFSAGFRMILRRDLPETRINFTVAHEICHTFFYERVPEIKFAGHAPDQEEERLCNEGAEELLMPARDVRRRARDKSESLAALLALALHYRVSAAAMLIRLRNLRLWNAELVLWHEMTNGSFAVKRLWGGTKGAWRWLDPRIPKAALDAPPEKILSGHGFWVLDAPGGERFRPVVYQVARHRGEVLALVLKRNSRKPPVATTGSVQAEIFPRRLP